MTDMKISNSTVMQLLILSEFRNKQTFFILKRDKIPYNVMI